MDNQITINKYKKLSLFGIFIFSISLICAIWQMNDSKIHFSTLIGTVIGWFVFSKYHTLIAIHNLKKITTEYVSHIDKRDV